MRVLIINTDYGPFLRSLYESNSRLATSSYEEQLRSRNETLFGVADFYSRNLVALGHDAWDVHANNGPMQLAWMSSRGITPVRISRPPVGLLRRLIERVATRLALLPPPRRSPLQSLVEPADLDLEQALVAQAQAFRPDVILNQSVSEVRSVVLKKMRSHVGLIVGQIASPLPEEESYEAYDLMVSSLPNFVRYYSDRGIPAQLNRLAFEPTVLDRIGRRERDIPLSFVGSITPDHKRRYDLLEYLADRTDIAIWGRVFTPEDSPIRRRYRGEAWGRDMYRILARSKITVNQHIDIAEGYANNMRLFEATGVGALLITDWKDNVADLFEPGKEVVCYRNAEECVELIKYYLAHEDEAAAIAAAGQRRTLRDHTYRSRAVELADMFAKNLASISSLRHASRRR